MCETGMQHKNTAARQTQNTNKRHVDSPSRGRAVVEGSVTVVPPLTPKAQLLPRKLDGLWIPGGITKWDLGPGQEELGKEPELPQSENGPEPSGKGQAGAIKQSIYVTLKHIYSVFDNDEVPEQWSVQEKFEDFQNILYRQTEENECVVNKQFESLDDFLKRETALRVYFEKLRTILKEKDFQYCAWEFVRDE
ncbi:hypothetical protein P4O66_018962, partial [Electrophorus voltai]